MTHRSRRNIDFHRIKRVLPAIVLTILVLNSIYAVTQTYHIDPRKAHEEVDARTLLSLYLSAATAIENYELEVVNESVSKIMDITKPSDINETSINIAENMITLAIEYYNATTLFNKSVEYFNKLNYALVVKYIHKTAFHIKKANLTIKFIVQDLNSLVRILKKKYVPKEHHAEIDNIKYNIILVLNSISRKLRQMYLKLLGMLREISGLGVGEGELGIGSQVNITRTNLTRTLLSVNLNKSEAYVGSTVLLYGSLKTIDNKALPNRILVVKIIFRGKVYYSATVKTDEEGRYITIITVPGIYDEEAKRKGVIVAVAFIPKGRDLGKFSYVVNSTRLKILYEDTYIKVNVPPTSFPGYNVTIQVMLKPMNPNITRRVVVSLDNELNLTIANVTQGVGKITFKLPRNTTPGPHLFYIYVEPEGIYGPAKAIERIIVLYMPLYFNVTAKSIVYYPVERPIIVGYVKSLGKPLAREPVIIYVEFLKLNKTIYTNERGYFNYTISLPLLITVKTITVDVMFKPLEPGYPEVVRRITIKVINLLPIFVSIGYFALLVFFSQELLGLYNRFKLKVREASNRHLEKHRLVAGSKGKENLRRISRSVSEKIMVTRTEHVIRSYGVFPLLNYLPVRGPYAGLYIQVLAKITERTRPPKPNETLEEYLNKSLEMLRYPKSKQLIWALEKIAYAPHKVVYSDVEILKEFISYLEG